MTNWRKILSYKTYPREFKIGDKVKFKDNTPISSRKYMDQIIGTEAIGTVLTIGYTSIDPEKLLQVRWDLPISSPNKWACISWLEHVD
jgi:hypothetical protein